MKEKQDRGFLVFSCPCPIATGSKVSIISGQGSTNTPGRVTLVDARLNCQEVVIKKSFTTATNVIVMKQFEAGSQYRHIAMSVDHVHKATKDIESGILNRSKVKTGKMND